MGKHGQASSSWQRVVYDGYACGGFVFQLRRTGVGGGKKKKKMMMMMMI
jgi:hypothetical protein